MTRVRQRIRQRMYARHINSGIDHDVWMTVSGDEKWRAVLARRRAIPNQYTGI